MSITTVVTNWPWPKATNTNNLRAWPLRAAARHRRISGAQASCAAGPWSGRALPARSKVKYGVPQELRSCGESMRRMSITTAAMNWPWPKAANFADTGRFLTVSVPICGKRSRKVGKSPDRLQIVHIKLIISQKCSGILILAKGPPNPMRFLPPKTHSKNPQP